MAMRLCLLMMALVLFTVALMWVIQIVVMENSYIDLSVQAVRNRLASVADSLADIDLKYDAETAAYLNYCANGKMMIADSDGVLIAKYSYGHPLDLGENPEEYQVWTDIKGSKEFEAVLARQPYEIERRNGTARVVYEIGLPTQYGGEPAYVVLQQSFLELWNVLDMNRKQLILFSVLLTSLSAVLAAFLARRFTKPIHIVKAAVEQLAMGNLTVKPELHLDDEVGDLAKSVEQLGQALQRVDTLRKEVIANVSHELRSPLALIGGYAEMVRDVHWQDQMKRESDLNLIIQEAQRMSEMVSDILDYSQLQSGYLQLHKEHYDLSEIVESQVLSCQKSAEKYQIELRFAPSALEMPVYLDALKITQVIRNLLCNAINHTESGNYIKVATENIQNGFRVSVENPGEPIPDEELIWERYQRSQHQGGRSEGTGLGLSIVSSILQAHNFPYGVDCHDGMVIFWFQCEKEAAE